MILSLSPLTHKMNEKAAENVNKFGFMNVYEIIHKYLGKIS